MDEKMKVKELIEHLKKMPEDAEVLSASDIEGAWTVLSPPVLIKYGNLNICILKEGWGAP